MAAESNTATGACSSRTRQSWTVFCTALAVATVLALLTGSKHDPFAVLEVKSQAILDAREVVQQVQQGIDDAADAAADHLKRCRGIDWQQACERIEGAGARRSLRVDDLQAANPKPEDLFLDSDDPSVTYDENCLRVYRLDLFGKTTFPYHANQLLRAGGNQTMALFIQHGAMRNADSYFCSFRRLMLEQEYRPFSDILVIAPDFNYKNDGGVIPTDAFWNATKPWGDWRVGAESDPECCANGFRTHGGKTISSFEILDHMLGLLSDKNIYPNMNKISYTGHSAGGQMVQRYAIMSHLTTDHRKGLAVGGSELEFIVANPSSYTYLNEQRFKYKCGQCECGDKNCTCDSECTDPQEISKLGVPDKEGVGSDWVCYDEKYNSWPYGLGDFADAKHWVPYALRTGVDRAIENYKRRQVVYMVGQNDTCTDDVFPTCDASCWKRQDYLPEEWPCFRNHMDTRCPALLEGQFRRMRGELFMTHLEHVYGEETHKLHVIDGVGHSAAGMFGSPLGLQELFD